MFAMPETSVAVGRAPNRKGHRRRKGASEGTPKTDAKKRRRAATNTVALGSTDDSNPSTDTEPRDMRDQSSVPYEDNEHRAQASDSPSDVSAARLCSGTAVCAAC